MTDKELKKNFDKLTKAGLTRRKIYYSLFITAATFKKRMQRLGCVDEYFESEHKKPTANSKTLNYEHSGIDAEKLKQFNKDFKESKRQITLKEEKDPYY